MTDATWVKFKQVNESTGITEIKSGILHGMTATKAAIENMGVIKFVQIEDVTEGWYF